MSAAPVEEFEVEDLDAAGVLQAAAEAEQAERRAAADELRLAYQWAVLNPATTETGVETPGGPALDVLTKDESLGGDGTPAVAAFTPETFALKLGISPAAGAQLIADALDLRHRLPLLWKRVPACRCRPGRPAGSPNKPTPCPWSAPAGSTNASRPAPTAASAPSSPTGWSPWPSPSTTPKNKNSARPTPSANSDVKLSHPDPTLYDGTSDLTATGDTLTLKAFYDLVCAIAHQLWLDGDTDPLGVRKIKAIGLITALVTGQAALDVAVRARHRARRRRPARSGSPSSSTPRTSTSTPRAGPPSRPARSNASVPPPWPSSANGSATPRSRSSGAEHAPA